MKTHIIIAIELDYVLTEYHPLRSISLDLTKLENGNYLWFFRAVDIKKVERLLGKPLSINREQLNYVEPYAPPVKGVVLSKAKKKGKGKFEITWKSPKFYIIETIINKKISRMRVPTVNIKTAWDVIKEYPIGKKIKTQTIAGNIMKKLKITRFNRESGNFDFAKFFGNRKDYYRYLYTCLKVLQADMVIKHHTNGMVERISNDWELQMRMIQ